MWLVSVACGLQYRRLSHSLHVTCGLQYRRLSHSLHVTCGLQYRRLSHSLHLTCGLQYRPVMNTHTTARNAELHVISCYAHQQLLRRKLQLNDCVT
jgi:hypothetical protein